MSHEASAYVKKLVHSPSGQKITQREKLLLAMLADYHNTARRAAWPSVATLAEECLMDERATRRTLADLQEKGVIQRIFPDDQGRGHYTEYVFCDLEKGGPNALHCDTEGGSKGGLKGGSKGGQIDTRNKEELGTLTRTVKPNPVVLGKNQPTLLEDPQENLIPDWVPREQWDGFVEMRKKMRSPMTEYAMRLNIGTLSKLRNQGHPPVAVLEQSITHGWKGLFELKENKNGTANRAEQRQQRNREAITRVLADGYRESP